MQWNALLEIIGRTVAVYLFIVLFLRIFGKKELAQLSVVDLVFILLISNSVQNAMLGPDTSLQGGLIAAAALFLTNYIFKHLLRRLPLFNRFVQGEPVMLIYKGSVKKENLSKIQMSMDELEAAVREHGVETIEKVDLAVFEVDGNISVLSHDFKQRSHRRRRSHKPTLTSNS
jgi:uncharacterized membrane protein YcaP (DUF421 family)